MRTVTTVLSIGLVVGSAAICRADDGDAGSMASPVQGGGVFMVSPMFGCNRNELRMPAQGRRPAMVLEDTKPEYGLFAMYAHPRVVVNNYFFRTDPNGAKVLGDIFYLNVYGPADKLVTWNLGGGYVWHRIESAGPTTEVDYPMAKVGAVIRWPGMNLSFNPYVGYGWERDETGSIVESTQAILYGVTAKWQWRMVHATVQYYREDNRDRDEHYNTVRGRLAVFMNRRVGLLARAEYTENMSGDDTAIMFGPVIVF